MAGEPMNAHRALVVDDDMVALLVIRHMLESEGIEVTQAANVGAARAQLAATDFDLIIIDYLMPDETGLDLLPPVGGTPLILLSGVIEHDDTSDPRLDEVTARLTKPVSTDELRSVVHALLARPAERGSGSGR